MSDLFFCKQCSNHYQGSSALRHRELYRHTLEERTITGRKLPSPVIQNVPIRGVKNLQVQQREAAERGVIEEVDKFERALEEASSDTPLDFQILRQLTQNSRDAPPLFPFDPLQNPCGYTEDNVTCNLPPENMIHGDKHWQHHFKIFRGVQDSETAIPSNPKTS